VIGLANVAANRKAFGSFWPLALRACVVPPKLWNMRQRFDARRRLTMPTNEAANVALWVRLDAKPGKEAEVEQFLRGGLDIVQQEPATVTWYALRLGPSTFGIFDTFRDDAGRQAHLNGRVAAALMAKTGELLSQPPKIEQVDVLAAKLP
jgi:quinol monooxygenase YgiN